MVDLTKKDHQLLCWTARRPARAKAMIDFPICVSVVQSPSCLDGVNVSLRSNDDDDDNYYD